MEVKQETVESEIKILEEKQQAEGAEPTKEEKDVKSEEKIWGKTLDEVWRVEGLMENIEKNTFSEEKIKDIVVKFLRYNHKGLGKIKNKKLKADIVRQAIEDVKIMIKTGEVVTDENIKAKAKEVFDRMASNYFKENKLKL